MSVYRYIPDPFQRAAERVLLTQSVNRKFFGLDQFGLSSPPYSGHRRIAEVAQEVAKPSINLQIVERKFHGRPTFRSLAVSGQHLRVATRSA